MVCRRLTALTVAALIAMSAASSLPALGAPADPAAASSSVLRIEQSRQRVEAADLDRVRLRAFVAGSSVKATTVVRAPYSTVVGRYGICVRDADGARLGYPKRVHVPITTSGTRYSRTKTFAPGHYTYSSCVYKDRRWHRVGSPKSFVVDAITPLINQPVGQWDLRFHDEFTGNAVDWSRWADESSAEADRGHGNKGNQQLEWNQGANCDVAGGVLTMTAKPDDIRSPSGTHYDWSSCLITSTPSYAFRYGYIEIRAKLPAPKGFWPGFWTWQAPGNEQWTETDVFEAYSDNHTRLYLSQHSGLGGSCTLTSLGFDPTDDFHVYGADIKSSGGTDFYVDGRLVCTARGSSTGMTNIIVDLFVYSRIPPEPGTVARQQVDYVRAWQRP